MNCAYDSFPRSSFLILVVSSVVLSVAFTQAYWILLKVKILC